MITSSPSITAGSSTAVWRLHGDASVQAVPVPVGEANRCEAAAGAAAASNTRPATIDTPRIAPFIATYGRRGPRRASNRVRLLERGEELDQVVELVRGKVGVGGHEARPDLDGALDGRSWELGADVGQVRAQRVAVLAELVARQAARLGRDLLAGLVLWIDLKLDLRRRAGGGTEEGQVRHRDDGQQSRRGRDRAPLGSPFRVAVVERQQQEQHHAERRDPDRRQRDERGALEHAPQLEEEEEVPLG